MTELNVVLTMVAIWGLISISAAAYMIWIVVQPVLRLLTPLDLAIVAVFSLILIARLLT